jgi:hypothetical protein
MAKTSAVASTTPASPKSSVKNKFIMGGASLVALLLGSVALYAFVALSISYSDGDRAGVLQKFSRKGWICKTYEGDLAVAPQPGMAPVIWPFSVRDETLVEKIREAQGKRVVLHYKEHRGVPTDCFGETQYYVDDVRIIE